MRMRSSTVIGWSAALGVAAGFAACSLHLDKSKMKASDDAGIDSSVGGSGGLSSGGSGGFSTGGSGGTVQEAGSECDASAQCLSDAGCVEGRCNNGNCLYDICPPTKTCTARTCDKSTGTCSTPISYKFNAGTIPVNQVLGCGRSATRCIAAMGDYVFVGTDSGLKVWRVTNPKAPESVPVVQPLFALNISRMVSNGKRVLVLGPKVAGDKLNVAWIDLPTAPDPKQIQTTSVQLQFADSYTSAYPANSDGFLLVRNSQNQFFPSGRLDPPLKNKAPLSLFANTGLPSGGWIVGASGKRLIQFRVDASTGVFQPEFGFENDSGTASAQYGGDHDLTASAGEVPTSLGVHRFASTYTGALLWSTNDILNVDAGLKESDAVIVRWPLLNASDTTFNGKRSIAVEQYLPPSPNNYNTPRAGPMALINSTTALVTAAYPLDTSQTSVRSVKRSGDKLSVSPAPPAPGFTLPVNINAIGVAAGRTFGYVLTPNSVLPGSPPNTTVYIFAPSCQ